MSLIARHLEANGLPTVVIGAARDIVEHCGVARLLHVDFPLGSPCGEPGNAAQQRQIVGMAFDLLKAASGPRTTVTAPFRWSQGDGWKRNVFTAEHPWKTGEVEQDWLKKKELYRQLKAEGKV